MTLIISSAAFNTFKRTFLHQNIVRRQGQILLVQQNLYFATKPPKDSPEIPKNILTEFHSASDQTEKGKIYDKKPFKMPLEAGKKYAWCACGHSKSQPFCDGTHRNPHMKIKMRPVLFAVAEQKDYWLCNCKQTSNRPFCDGTHKQEEIQAAIRS